MLGFLFCFLPFAPTAASDDCTGVWIGQLTLDGKRHQIELVLKHEEQLSGNLKIEEDSAGLRLQRASIEGHHITFECWTSGHRITLEGTLTTDTIEGHFVITRGEEMRKGTWRVTRSSRKVRPAPPGVLAKWTGTWSGATMLGFQRGRVTLVLEAMESGMLSGHLRPQDEKRLPLKTVTVDGDRLSVEVSVDGAAVTLEGTLAEDSIIGRFTMARGEEGVQSGMWRVVRTGSWKEKTLPAIPKPQPIGELTKHEKEVFLPFYAREDKDFTIARTYYVAGNVVGASNDNNGLYPDHRGGKDGPFRDFNDGKVRGQLFGPDDGVRMIVREGTYVIENIGEDGVVLNGRGDEFHPVILSGYPGERAVLTSDGTVNVPIQVHGRHGIVEDLVVASDREVKYDLIVTGDNAIVRNCVFFGPVHEDCIKIGDQADHCFVFNNDISGYGSQCVDNFGINILFRKNHVHHAGNWKANALGTKGGTRNVVVTSNVFHDLSGGISFGGTGNLELYRRDEEGNLLHATTDAVAVNNTFYNIVGPAVDFQSCLNGVFEGNTIRHSAAGFRVGLASEQFEGEWKEFAVGLPATRGTVIRNNCLADIAGDTMFLVEQRAREGLVAGGNMYHTNGEPVFLLGRRKLTLEEFRRELGVEEDSEVKPAVRPSIPAYMLGDPELFDRTMAHVSDDALLDAFDLTAPELAGVKEAAAQNTKAALEAFCRHLAQRERPVAVPTVADYHRELDNYRRLFPAKADSLARLYNSMHEWTLSDANRIVRGEHLYAGSATNWVKFEKGHVDWVTNHGNLYGFHYMGSLEPLLLAWLCTEDEKYAKALADAFNDWWEQRDEVKPQRVVWYKLGLAIRGARLAQMLHHLARTESLDASTQTRMLKTIVGSCRWLMRDWERQPAWNSNWGLFVARGLIQMGTLFPEFRESAAWIEQGEEIMRRYARAVKPDGGTEALGYHAGIIVSLTRPQQLLRANHRPGYLDDSNLRDSLRQAVHLLAKITMPNGQFPAIGDCRYGDPVEALSLGADLLQDAKVKGVLARIGEDQIRKDGAFHVPGQDTFADVSDFKRNFLPRIPAQTWHPTSCSFPDQGLTVLRTGGSPSDETYLAISHGTYDHSHPDLLGVTLFAYGDLLLGDRGVPNYYGPHATEMRRSKAHSTLVVDGTDMRKKKPAVTLFKNDVHADLWQCRSHGYASHGVSHTRTIALIKRERPILVIIDQVKRLTTDVRELDVYFHCMQPKVIVESPQRVIVGSGPILTISSPDNNGTLWQGKEWSISLESNMTTAQLPFLAYRKKSAADERFCCVLAPDPASSRNVHVTWREDPPGALKIEIWEDGMQDTVTVGKRPGVVSVSR